MGARDPSPAATGRPFDLADDKAYRDWREWKLARRPGGLDELTVEVRDPRALTVAERTALLHCIERANVAVYRSAVTQDDPGLVRALGAQLGLHALDANWLADEDGISAITVSDASDGRGGFIPYTNRAIGWHTDGYYHAPDRLIRSMILHCVRPAAEGGANALLDHELAYIALRDRDPALVQALMQPDAMLIPARNDDDGVARPAQGGPVFSVDAADGSLHMRYTARTRSIEWQPDAATQAAVAALRALLASDTPGILRGRLEAGMGLVGRNLLHDRAAFVDDPAHPRLLYRARYCDRIAVGFEGQQPMAQWLTVWRAAQLLGLPRGTLQQRVRAGELELNDGLVSTSALLALYPQAQFETSGLLERVAQIREESFGRRLRERLLPSQEVLAQRLFQQSQELADTQRHLQRYHALVVALRDSLLSLTSELQDTRLLDLQRQLNDGLARALATESVDLLDVMDDMLKVMSAQVTLRPSGHQFVVEGHDTLLQAGMRAGLKLNYGCGNGSCGMCKVRVTAGQVVRTMHTDYPLSAQEKEQGYVLACAHTAGSSELTLETLEAAGPADIPQQRIVTSVRAIRPLAPDTLLLHLQTPRSHRLRFLAGQSLVLGAAVGDGLGAQYPVASCPCDDRNLHFFVARDAGDALACALFAGHIKTGDAVSVEGPIGDFVLAEGSLPLVFVACDTGFAPVKSLIEHALSLDASPSITLYWLATRPDGHFMANQCRAWSEALDPFEFALSTHADAAEGARQLAASIRADLFDIDCAFYVAGPADFTATLQAELAAAAVPATQIRCEVIA